jgi:hypothetical protein
MTSAAATAMAGISFGNAQNDQFADEHVRASQGFKFPMSSI